MKNKEYSRWLSEAKEDPDLINELKTMSENEIEDAFYADLEFGTGGLRGIIGAGTNRMNIYTVGKATQGISDYIRKNYVNGSVAISYDSRIKSELFAKTAAMVFAANGIKSYLYDTLMPTPCLSFAVRALECSMGIMITASHNPARYNGYKVYNSDGCQITINAANEILAAINKIDPFSGVKKTDFDDAFDKKLIEYIPNTVYDDFIKAVRSQSVLFGDKVNKDVSIVYSPLNGTGLRPVLRALKESGFNNITVVKEQENPDGNFPTCKYPNPEIKEALDLGITYAEKTGAQLLIATDPDCDRVGIAVKTGDGYRLMSGNEVGILLLDFICSQRIKHNKMPEDPVAVKTIVTIDLAERIAEKYGVEIKNVLTGFKFIGEQIGFLEEKGQENRYIFGFEESYGYLSGSYVRDKDAVNGVLLISEMFAFYNERGITLQDKLNELYKEFGFTVNKLFSFEFPGAAGFKRMNDLMLALRTGKAPFDNISTMVDYNIGIDELPKSNVIKYVLQNGDSVVIRPSGTEPKIKIYTSVTGTSCEDAETKTNRLTEIIKEFFSE